MRILIRGASGSGTSTLGRAVASELGCGHLDLDDFYWVPTEPPYREKRDPASRLELLREALTQAGDLVLTG